MFLTTHDLAGVERIADRVGILNDGRLLLCEETESLKSRFRSVRYRSEVTEGRTDFGNELDEMEPLRAKVRGWGIEAVVNGYSDDRFERFGAEASLSLEAGAKMACLDDRLFVAATAFTTWWSDQQLDLFDPQADGDLRVLDRGSVL